MKKIYIDLGAHKGKTVLARCQNFDDDIIYAFEPNPACLSHANWGRIRERYSHVHLIQKAAWTETGHIPLYRSPTRPNSEWSSVLREKKTGDLDFAHPLDAECVDFSAWLARTVALDDEVVIKMDIEGAEYAVLEKMVIDGTIERVMQLRAEFHEKKLAIPHIQAKHGALIATLDRLDVDLVQFAH